MAFRDRTAKYVSYRDLKFAGSMFRRRDRQRKALGGVGGSGAGGGSRTRVNGKRDYVAITVGEVEEDGAENGNPVWMEFRDHVNNCIHETDKLLRELRNAHRSQLTGFGVDAEHKAEALAQRVTAKIKEAEQSINMVYPKGKAGKASEDSAEGQVKRNIQMELNQKLYRVTMQFRKQQKQFIFDKVALEKKKSKFANYFMNAADDIELPPDADDISDAQLQSMAISKNILSERDSQITKIAQGIQEIAGLFKDLANLTIEQGTVLDRIDNDLEVTLENTQQGTKELVAAEEIQKQMTKSLKIVAVLVAIVTIEACLLIVKHT